MKVQGTTMSKKRTIFEFLSIADKERIHTQMLAWALSRECDELDALHRSRLINKLFGLNMSASDADHIEVIVEVSAPKKSSKGQRKADAGEVTDDAQTERGRTNGCLIDLVLISREHVIAIENKLKSHQGSDQLERIEAALTDLARDPKTQGLFSNRVKKLYLLTFSGERTTLPAWQSIGYDLLLSALAEIVPSDRAHSYLCDYSRYLSALLGHQKTFLASHHEYPGVFERCGKSSLDRVGQLDGGGELETFLWRHRLEGIFVQSLFHRCLSELGIEERYVSEGNTGIALLQVNTHHFKVENRLFRAGFQFQGTCPKLNVGALDYGKSNSGWLKKELISSLDKQVLPRLKTYKSNAARSRAYRSWTPKSERRMRTGQLNPASHTVDELKVRLAEHLEMARQIWSEALAELEAQRKISDVSPLLAPIDTAALSIPKTA